MKQILRIKQKEFRTKWNEEIKKIVAAAYLKWVAKEVLLISSFFKGGQRGFLLNSPLAKGVWGM